MSLKTDVDKLAADVVIAHNIVHGPANGAASQVATEGGTVKTFARAVSEIIAGTTLAFFAATGGAAPNTATSQVQIWQAGGTAVTSFVDSTRTVNNRVHSLEWGGGALKGRFLNDAQNAALDWVVVTGGQAAGISGIQFPAVGPYAFGGATNVNSQLTLTGAFTAADTGSTNSIVRVVSTLAPAVNAAGVGIHVATTINKAASGTHADFAGVSIDPPSIGAGASALTNATTLKITGAPSVGTNQRALWVVAGSSLFGGNAYLDGTAYHADGAVGTPSLAFSNDGTTGFFRAGTGIVALTSAGTEAWRVTAGRYFKASNSGTYVGATGLYHEFYTDNDATNAIIRFKHAGATTNNQYGVYIILAGDPNNTTNFFFQCVGNATERITGRSNGGIANFSANDVNLSDVRVKKIFETYGEVAGLMPKLWNAHKNMRDAWGRYKYDDQTHDDWNFGYGAQHVAKAFAGVAEELVDQWNPKDKGKRLLAVYDNDLAHITGAVVTEAQFRIEDLTARLDKAEAALVKAGITLN